MSPPVRKQSIAEAATANLDKNTVILMVNLIILVVLMGLLYVVASSAMGSASLQPAASSAQRSYRPEH